MPTDSNQFIFKPFGSNADNKYKPIEFGNPSVVIDPTNADAVNQIRGNAEWERGIEGNGVVTNEGIYGYTSGNIENTKFLANDLLIARYLYPRGIFAYSSTITYNLNSYCFDITTGIIYQSVADLHTGEALNDTNFWVSTGQTTNSYITQNTPNLIFNSEFYDSRAGAGKILSQRNWTADGIVAYRYFVGTYSYFVNNVDGKKSLRIKIPDTDTSTESVGVNFYLSQEETIALRGKQMNFSCYVNIGENFNTSENARFRARVGYTEQPNLVGEVNGDFDLKNALGITTITAQGEGTVFIPPNPAKNTDLLLKTVFTVPNNAYNIIITVQPYINDLVADKVANPAFPDTFYFDIKQPQLTLGAITLPYKPTGYISSHATAFTTNKPIALTYSSATTLTYSTGAFEFDDGTGKGVVMAGSVVLTDFYPTPTINAPYYMFAVKNPTTNEATVIISDSKTTPTLPTGFTKKAYIGALMTNSSGQIRPCLYVYGNGVYEAIYTLGNVVIDSTDAVFTTTEKTIALTAPSNVFPIISVNIQGNSSTTGLVDLSYYSSLLSSHVFTIIAGGSSTSFMHNFTINNIYVPDSILRYISSVNFTALFARINTIGWKEYL